MNYIKNFLWVFFTSLLYASGTFGIGGIYPELLFAFCICYGAVCEDFSKRIGMAIVCGIIMSALGGRGFVFSMLVCTYSVIAVGFLASRFPKLVRTLPVTAFIITVIYESIFYLFIPGFADEPLQIILMAALYNFIIVCVMKPLVKLSYGKKERYIFN